LKVPGGIDLNLIREKAKTKRLLLVVSVIGVLLLAGCSSAAPTGNIVYEGNQTIPTLTTGFGIYGSKVEFNGVYPGWSGTVPLTIVNGQDRDRLFRISVVSPANPKTGYDALPQQYLYWITISQPTITVLKGGNFQVPITLAMPADSDYKGKKAEVRILVEDTTQTGLVQIAVESRWFIVTAD